MLAITNWKILAVDDEPDNLSLLSDILSFYNVSITVCNSGAEALKIVEEKEFDLVLLDIQMPQMSGWDVIKAIREHTNLKVRNLLVVAVTALAMPKDRDRMAEAGFNGYVGKPLEIESFMLKLQEITQRESAKAKEDKAEQSATPHASEVIAKESPAQEPKGTSAAQPENAKANEAKVEQPTTSQASEQIAKEPAQESKETGITQPESAKTKEDKVEPSTMPQASETAAKESPAQGTKETIVAQPESAQTKDSKEQR